MMKPAKPAPPAMFALLLAPALPLVVPPLLAFALPPPAPAPARSTAFGNNSAVWSESSVLGSTRIGLAGGDYKGQ